VAMIASLLFAAFPILRRLRELHAVLSHNESVHGHFPVLAVKLQLEPLEQKRLEHQPELGLGCWRLRLRFNVVDLRIDPGGTDNNFSLIWIQQGRWNLIGKSDHRAQRLKPGNASSHWKCDAGTVAIRTMATQRDSDRALEPGPQLNRLNRS